MNTGHTVFSQIMDLLPHWDFHNCVKRYQGNRKTQTFSCMDQFLCMAFAQLTYRESLRDIEVCDLPPFVGPVFMRGFHASELHYPLAFAV